MMEEDIVQRHSAIVDEKRELAIGKLIPSSANNKSKL
jgi:hypothetical protein